MNKPFYEEGLYIGKVTQQGIGESGTGKPQVVIRAKILGVPIDETSHTPVKQQFERTVYMTVTDKTAPFIVENLRTIGFEGDKLSEFDPSHKDHVSLVGNQIPLWCKHEETQDGTGVRERWQISKGLNTLELKPLAAKQTRELDSLFAKALKAAPAAKKVVKPNQHGVKIDDTDLPPEMSQGDDGDPGWDDDSTIPF